MRKRSFATASILILFCLAMSAASRVDGGSQAAANAMLNRFADSWNRADGTAYGENYWPEAELVDPVGIICVGKNAIVQEHVNMWAGPFKGSHVTGRIRRIQQLGANYMIVDIDLEVSGVSQVPSGGPGGTTNGVLKNHLKHVMEKRHGVWKILSAQNTFIAAS
jgi:uncharacterized protein (TIGR02246 family)